MVVNRASRYPSAVLLAALLLFFDSASAQQNLERGVIHSFDSSVPSAAFFSLLLPQGTVARLRLDQSDGDALVHIERPRGTEREVDAFDFGSETVTIAAAEQAQYRIKIFSAVRALRARGSVVLESASPSDNLDARWALAENLATASKKAVSDGTQLVEALDLAASSIAQWHALRDPFGVARTRLRVGDIYFRHSDWDKAGLAYLEARDNCRSLGNLRCEAEAANNAGLAALKRSDVDQAFAQLEFAAEAWKTLHLIQGEASTRSNLGLLYWHCSEWQQALDQYERARDLFKGTRPLLYARVLNNLGLVYMSMAEFDRAAAYFKAALSVRTNRKSARRDVGRFELNLGRARMFAGHLAAALADEREALAALEAVDDRTGVADAYNPIGQIRLRMNRLADAKNSLERASQFYKNLGDRRGLASALHFLGVVAMRTGGLSQARSCLEQALQIRNDHRLRDQSAETLYELAIVARKTGEPAAAEKWIREAIELTETLRVQVEGERLRRTYYENKRAYSEFLIELLMSSEPTGETGTFSREAFAISDGMRARALLDTVSEIRLAEETSSSRDLTARMDSVRRRLNFKSVQLAAFVQSQTNAFLVAGLRQEIDQLLAEESEIGNLIPERGPRDRTPPVTVAVLQEKLLGESDLLMEYFLGAEHSYAFRVSKHSLLVERLPPRAEIERLARNILDSFNDVRGRQDHPEKAIAFAHRLQQLSSALGLFAEATSPASRIVIIADGVLHRVPFAALPLKDASRHSAAAPAGLLCELVEVPSASLFRVFRSRSRLFAALPVRVEAFADPVFDAEDSRVGHRSLRRKSSTITTGGAFDLARLPFSQIEAETVERLLPPAGRRVHRGFKATREAFLDPQTWRSSVVMASTHAFADEVQPELSSIVFSMVDESGEAVDGLVRLYDIYHLRIPASLVVLSACETSRGREDSGNEGPIDIARGFIFAGASALLAPVDKVDAESSAALTGHFLESLLRGPKNTPSRALRSARVSVARSSRWKDPYYWSSFVLASSFD